MEKLTKGLSLVIAVLAISAVGEAWYIMNQQNQIEELNFRITSLPVSEHRSDRVVQQT